MPEKLTNYSKKRDMLFPLEEVQKGYALRLYDKIIKDDLEIICRVRNAFAHSPRAINFDTPEVLSAIMSRFLSGPGRGPPARGGACQPARRTEISFLRQRFP